MSLTLEQLESENRRLTRLVTALAEKSLQLEAELARYKERYGQLQIPVKEQNGVQNPEYNPLGKENGMEHTELIPENLHAGIQNEHDDLQGTPTGVYNETYIPQSQQTGVVRMPSIPQSEKNGVHNQNNILQNPDALAGLLPPDLRQTWEHAVQQVRYRTRLQQLHEAGIPRGQLETELRKGPMAGCRDLHIADAAVLLLWHCGRKPTEVSYPLLRSVTGLTDSGVNKLLASLRRRGLLEWRAYRVYGLTERALVLLEQLANAAKN